MRTLSLCIALLLALAAPAAAQRSLACGPRGITLAVGDSARLHAAAIDLLGRLRSDAAVLWGSLDEDVATVNAEGMVRARAAGRALVWCAWAVGPHLDTLFVQVTEPPPPPPPPQDEEEPPPPPPPPSSGGPQPPPVGDARVLLDLRAGSATDLQRVPDYASVRRWFTESYDTGIQLARDFDGSGTTALRVVWPGRGTNCAEITRWVRKYPLRPAGDPTELWLAWRAYFGRHPADAGTSFGAVNSFAFANPNCGTGGNAGRKYLLMGRSGGGNEGRTDVLLPGPPPVHLRIEIGTEGWARASGWSPEGHVGRPLQFVARFVAASADGASDGIIQIWLDGQLIYDRHDVPATARGWRGIEIPSVFNSPLRDQVEYIWDLVVWTP